MTDEIFAYSFLITTGVSLLSNLLSVNHNESHSNWTYLFEAVGPLPRWASSKEARNVFFTTQDMQFLALNQSL